MSSALRREVSRAKKVNKAAYRCVLRDVRETLNFRVIRTNALSELQARVSDVLKSSEKLPSIQNFFAEFQCKLNHQNQSRAMGFMFNIDGGYLEGLCRGFKCGILKQSDYLNLVQCETLEGKGNLFVLEPFSEIKGARDSMKA